MTWNDRDGHEYVNWSQDSKYILYGRKTDNQSDLWALPLKTGLFRHNSTPIRLTSGPLSYFGAFPSPDGKTIFTIGTKSRAELVRYDLKSRQFVPFLPGLSAIEPCFSADDKWMAYLSYPDLSVWRSHLDGSERRQLTFPPMRAIWPSFSRDGTKIVFRSPELDSYVVNASGGEPRKIAEQANDAHWSPDGRSLVFFTQVEDRCWLRIVNLATGEVSDVPSTEGMLGAWYLNSNTLVAYDIDKKKFVTFDFTHHRRADLLAATQLGDLASAMPLGWTVSPDRAYLYYMIGGKDLKLLRVGLSDRKSEPITSLKDFRQATNPTNQGMDFAVAPDGSLMFSRDLSSREIYALNIRWQ